MRPSTRYNGIQGPRTGPVAAGASGVFWDFWVLGSGGLGPGEMRPGATQRTAPVRRPRFRPHSVWGRSRYPSAAKCGHNPYQVPTYGNSTDIRYFSLLCPTINAHGRSRHVVRVRAVRGAGWVSGASGYAVQAKMSWFCSSPTKPYKTPGTALKTWRMGTPPAPPPWGLFFRWRKTAHD